MKLNNAQLSAMLEEPEGSSLEFKNTLEFPESIARTACAFANTFGGYIVIGVEKRGGKSIINGVRDTDESFQKIAAIISSLQPKPYHEAAEYNEEGKKIIALRIDELPVSDLCFMKKSVFRRVGSINEEVFGPNLARFLQQRGTISFEGNRSGAKIEDLDMEKIANLLEKRGVNMIEHKPFSTESLLASLGVANAIGGFFIKNSAVLFFSADVKNFFMNSEVRIIKCRGKEKTIESLEYDERFIDTLPELLQKIFEKTKEKAGKFNRIIDGKRVEMPMVPDEALREALTNAVGHRDYFDPNGIMVEVYDDRIEITNPGGLLPGQTLGNIAEIRKHRNPVIYRLLNDSQWGEGLNLGIKAMYRIMRRNRLADPIFEEIGGVFRATLFGPLSSRKYRPRGMVSGRQEKAIAYVKKHGAITAPMYSKLAGISHPTAIKELNELVTRGVMDRKGRYRSSKYVPVN